MYSVRKSVPQTTSSKSFGNDEAPILMFQERCGLVTKWFSKWNTTQRRTLIQELIDNCSQSEQEFIHEKTRRRIPRLRVDFTQALPKSLSLRIFSYLDPRSLCRSAQVNWHWNWLCESNEIWMPKCNRLRWLLPAEAHSDIEQTMHWTGKLIPAGVYKRLYRKNLIDLQSDGTVLMERERLLETARRQDSLAETERRARRETARRLQLPLTQPVWRAADRRPTETLRYNVLENRDSRGDRSWRADKPPLVALQPRNTMRSVVMIPSGKPKSAVSPERAELAMSTRSLFSRPLSESTTQTTAQMWQAAAAAAAAAGLSPDEKAKEKKKEKKKKEKKKKNKDSEGEESGAEDGKEEKKKKKKKKKKDSEEEDSAGEEGGKDEKKKKKKKKKKKESEGEDSAGEDSGTDDKKKKKKKKKKKESEDEDSAGDDDEDGGKKKKKKKKKKEKKKDSEDENSAEEDDDDKKKKKGQKGRLRLQDDDALLSPDK